MINICAKLQDMLRDEATGILAYNKIKNDMPSEHKSHIEKIEKIIEDEYEHLQTVYQIMKDMNCPIERSEEIEAKLREIAVTEEKTEEKTEGY